MPWYSVEPWAAIIPCPLPITSGRSGPRAWRGPHRPRAPAGCWGYWYRMIRQRVSTVTASVHCRGGECPGRRGLLPVPALRALGPASVGRHPGSLRPRRRNLRSLRPHWQLGRLTAVSARARRTARDSSPEVRSRSALPGARPSVIGEVTVRSDLLSRPGRHWTRRAAVTRHTSACGAMNGGGGGGGGVARRKPSRPQAQQPTPQRHAADGRPAAEFQVEMSPQAPSRRRQPRGAAGQRGPKGPAARLPIAARRSCGLLCLLVPSPI